MITGLNCFHDHKNNIVEDIDNTFLYERGEGCSEWEEGTSSHMRGLQTQTQSHAGVVVSVSFSLFCDHVLEPVCCLLMCFHHGLQSLYYTAVR